MTIKVIAINRITSNEIKEILEHYNISKLPEDASLKYMSCPEGGFKLDISMNEFLTKYKKFGAGTPAIKQLRWYRNLLVSYYNYPGFSEEEESRLYAAMSAVLGREHVKYYKAFSEAVKSSPPSRIYIKSSPIHKKTSPIITSLVRTMSMPKKIELSNGSDFSDVTSHIWSVPRIRI